MAGGRQKRLVGREKMKVEKINKKKRKRRKMKIKQKKRVEIEIFLKSID